LEKTREKEIPQYLTTLGQARALLDPKEGRGVNGVYY
jgi:hypothetical protein